MSSEKIKILLIDDNKLFRDSLSACLDKHQYEVVAELDKLNEAFTYVKDDKVSVVFLDLVMPNQDSLSFLSTVKRQYPKIKIIVCSSLKEEHVISKALEAGCFDYLSKPLEEPKLMECLEKIKGLSA